MPVKELIGVCRRHDVMILVDGAHTPGHLQLDLDKLGAHFFSGYFVSTDHYRRCPHNMQSRVYETVERPSVSLPVCPIDNSSSSNSGRRVRCRAPCEQEIDSLGHQMQARHAAGAGARQQMRAASR